MSLRILKYLIGSVVTFLVVWAGFITWWQRARIMPSHVDILTGLFAFPLAILVGFVALKKAIDMTRSLGRPAAETAPALSSSGATEAEPRSGIAAGYCLRLLASRIHTPIGKDGESVWSFLSESQSKQDMDRALLADEGISAFVAKDLSLNVAATQQLVADSDRSERGAGCLREADLRTLQLLFELAEEMIPECGAHLASSKVSAEHKAGTPRLFVKAFVPADWEPRRCEWVSARLAQLFTPVDGGGTSLDVTVHSASSGIDVLKTIDDLNVELNSVGTGDLFLVLAAESVLDPARILRWHAEGVILGAGRKGEIVPGEGAAAILLQANTVLPRGEPAQTVLLRRLALGRDDALGKKCGPHVVETVASEAIGLAGLQKSDIAAFVADADRRGAQQAEVMRLVSIAYPHVEAPENVVSVGMATGFSSVPLGLIALSLAHIYAETAERPIVVLSVQDEYERGAVVVCPSLQQEYA